MANTNVLAAETDRCGVKNACLRGTAFCTCIESGYVQVIHSRLRRLIELLIAMEWYLFRKVNIEGPGSQETARTPTR